MPNVQKIQRLYRIRYRLQQVINKMRRVSFERPTWYNCNFFGKSINFENASEMFVGVYFWKWELAINLQHFDAERTEQYNWHGKDVGYRLMWCSRCEISWLRLEVFQTATEHDNISFGVSNEIHKRTISDKSLITESRSAFDSNSLNKNSTLLISSPFIIS